MRNSGVVALTQGPRLAVDADTFKAMDNHLWVEAYHKVLSGIYEIHVITPIFNIVRKLSAV